MGSSEGPRRLPVGAEVAADGVHFRVWAPRRRTVEVVPEDGGAAVALAPEEGGYFSGAVLGAGAGMRYRYRLDGGAAFPDPASRFQPEGPHGPSQVIDPGAFRWTDTGWEGAGLSGQVLYEMHVGTFTAEGSWAAAARELPELAALGVTVVEVMPVAEFPGRFGWGYDGVDLFAPTRLYGEPDDLRRFVDAAHAAGVGVILDVVYNHLGPDGCYLREFSEAYFSDRYENEWGDPLNFDGPDSAPVREFFVANAGYWIDEFHLDGLRLDATQQVFDASDDHLLAAVARRVREAARGRRTLLVAENEPQDARLVRAPEGGGYGLDALWNDDFHHALRVALTGRQDAYYSDYAGSAQEVVSLVRRGFLFQGQRSAWQGKPRGSPAGEMAPAAFVCYLQNHDQVANSLAGRRLHQLAAPGAVRAATALLLLGPGTPLLFQGQEFAASAPFLYFADHEPELAAAVRKGRADFLRQFPGAATAAAQAALPDPGDEATFRRCTLDMGERERHAAWYALHRDLLRLRREDSVLCAVGREGMDGAVLGPGAVALRAGEERLLLVNLGADLHLRGAAEPLLAPPAGRVWRMLWSSEHPAYGGSGAAAVEREDGWWVPGLAAVVLEAG